MRPRVDPTAPLFDPAERAFLRAVVRLAYGNPFHPERVEAERDALAGDFMDGGENTALIGRRLGPLLASSRDWLIAGASPCDDDRGLYQDACLYFLRVAHEAPLQQMVDQAASRPLACAALYRDLRDEHGRLLHFPGSTLRPPEPDRVLACAYQIRRAIQRISTTLIGASRPLSALRAAIWQAIFTCDLSDYMAAPEGCMDDISTLVTGQTGTGKELVAQAIGGSGYIAVDPSDGRLVAAYEPQLSTVNLAALPATLIESELFGHERGAFTGAERERRGWLESCGRGGVVFLDEIGELALELQVKLLRFLETRTFQRVGDTEDLRFQGRIVSATHRDLAERIAAGAFRHDLYQRLCACSIRTPSLREQLDDAPEERRRLVRFIAGKVRPSKAEALTDQVERWIDEKLPPDYPWPGNVRQLGQCVREIFVSGDYHPIDVEDEDPVRSIRAGTPSIEDEDDDPVRSIRAGTLSKDQLFARYAAIVHARTGSVAETARVLGVHRHTVARMLDAELLARLKAREELKPEPPKR